MVRHVQMPVHVVSATALWGLVLFVSDVGCRAAKSGMKPVILSEGKGNGLQNWGMLGPFPISKNEFDGDPTKDARLRGPANVGWEYVTATSKSPRAKFRSEYVNKGWVGWQVVTANRGAVSVQHKVDWQGLVNSVGGHELLEHQSLLVSPFKIDRQSTVTTWCTGTPLYWIDDRRGNSYGPFSGNAYFGQDSLRQTLTLPKGQYLLRTRVRVKHKGQFGCSASIESTPTIADFDVKLKMVPDWQRGVGPLVGGDNIFISVSLRNPLLNWGIVLFAIDGDQFEVISDKGWRIAPSQTIAFPISIRAMAARNIDCAAPFVLKVKVSEAEFDKTHILTPTETSSGLATAIKVSLRCRERGSSIIFTFADRDGSVQHAAAVHPPIDSCGKSATLCPILLTLHGTSISVSDSADAFKMMKKGDKDYTFGFSEGWLLAPSRHGAHNWEGVGRLHALSAVKALARYTIRSEYPANEHALVVAGHSMGGHGAWLFAVQEPGRTLCVNPNAGWIRKEDYGDSNTLFMHDFALHQTDPKLKFVFEASISENQVDLQVENLAKIPVLARVGAADTTTHPWYTRRLVRMLSGFSGNVTYSEVAAKEHWWWDTKQANDGGVVNDAQLRTFFRKCVQQPQSFSLGDNFSITTYNAATTGVVHGFSISQQVVTHQRSRIEVVFVEAGFMVTTFNVRRVCVDRQRWKHLKTIVLELDRTTVELMQSTHNNNDDDNTDGDGDINGNSDGGGDGDGDAMCVELVDVGAQHQQRQQWQPCQQKNTGERQPSTYGPLRQALENSFVIVYPSNSDKFYQSALYVANLLQDTGDVLARLISDAEDMDVFLADTNVHNAIFIGGHRFNKWAASMLDNSFSVRVFEDGVQAGDCHYAGDGVGVAMLQPFSSTTKRSHGLALVLDGTTEEGVVNAVLLATPTIPPMVRQPFSNTLPDFLVLSPTVRHTGAGGVLAAGYYNNHWGIEVQSSYLSHCSRSQHTHHEDYIDHPQHTRQSHLHNPDEL